MKKISIVLIICLLALCLTSCINEEEDTAEEEVRNNELVAQIEELKASIDDPVFWSSSERAIRMAGEALEVGYPVSIDFRLQVGDHTKTTTGYDMYLDGSADYCREYNVSRVIYELANDDIVANAHSLGQTVEITGFFVISLVQICSQLFTKSVVKLLSNLGIVTSYFYSLFVSAVLFIRLNISGISKTLADDVSHHSRALHDEARHYLGSLFVTSERDNAAADKQGNSRPEFTGSKFASPINVHINPPSYTES